MFAGYDALGSSGEAAGHYGPVADAGQIMQGEIGVLIGIGNGNARLDMITCPSKSWITDARVIHHPRHARQNTRGAARVRGVTGIAQSGLADIACDGDFD